MEFPSKIKMLHEGEEFLRKKSTEAIESDEDLTRHVHMIEKAMDVLNYFSSNFAADESEDLKTIRLLGMRLFNGCAAATQLTLSGYYQAAAMLLRDLLETVFLLGYFGHDHTMIAKWREASEQERKKQFSPVKIRIALDEKDGFTEKKRAAAYELLCELATHPTYKGFRMLMPTGNSHHCGPFFDFRSLKAIIEELAQLSLQAGQHFSPFFDQRTKDAYTVKVLFLEATGEWLERYFGRPYDKKVVDELKELLETLV